MTTLSTLMLACSARPATSTDAASVEGRGSPPTLCESYDGDAAAPAYTTIQQIFDENCNGCHIAGADLPLTPGPAYPLLVGQLAPAAEACGGVLVQPGHPESSYLYQKLSLDAPCAGSRMPRGDFGAIALPDCVVEVVRRWISEGAPGPDEGAPTGADSGR